MEIDAASCAQTQHEQSVGQTPIKFDLDKIDGPIHFIGIGGIGMSAIARLLLGKGRAVSGSDKSASSITEELEALGAKIFIGHQASNVKDAGALVVSTAIQTDNPEYAFAQERNLPICHRSDLLSMLSKSSKLIAISGTHGKTTTTGMVGQILLDCRVDPSIVVGGIFDRIGSNAHLGKSEYFVAEADESDRTHAQVTSYISVLTNIEADHLENYPGGLKQIRDVMASFANGSSFAVVICGDDEGCRAVMPAIDKRMVVYGKRGGGAYDYSYESLPGFGMKVFKKDTLLGTVELSVPGEHNKSNALAAMVVAFEMGQEFDPVAESIATFSGVDRRFQIIGEHNQIVVVDDYAHHPTEVVALLQAARQYIQGRKELKRTVAIFQPHQPGRLRDLWNEFCGAFANADVLFVADVYVARGKGIENITSERFCKEVKHPGAIYLNGPTETLTEKVAAHLVPGDLVITIGAGDITNMGPALVKHLVQGHSNGSTK
ncbi:MAG: UDP-N-acetylmuramate--L-alanine ligase [Candidatus Melainabacteria bacterium]|nr:MAG: UDP-N-acetylmuramate--L-alanine ligase [Candidatus Melainabacteria bacterium]